MRNPKYTMRDIRSGFTLIEVLVATILVGLAIASLVGANISFSQANGAGSDLSTAEFLAGQIRERMAMMNYSNLQSLDDAVFSPPIDADGQQLSAFPSFSQQVTVENVSTSDFEQVVADGSSDFVRITVEVSQNNQTLSSTSCVRADY